MKRPSASARRAMTSRPLPRSAAKSASSAGERPTRCRRLSAIERMGASELLISWPSTRTSRSKAWRSSARSARDRLAATTSVDGRPCWRTGPRRTSSLCSRAAEREREGARRIALQERAEAERARRLARHLLGIATDEPRAGAVAQREHAVRVEDEERDVDRLHHPAHQRRRFEGAVALAPQRRRQRVGLVEGDAERVIVARVAPADRKVALAQRRQQVRQRLQRARHLLAHRQRQQRSTCRGTPASAWSAPWWSAARATESRAPPAPRAARRRAHRP